MSTKTSSTPAPKKGADQAGAGATTSALPSGTADPTALLAELRTLILESRQTVAQGVNCQEVRMKWAEIRAAHPNVWLVVEAIQFHEEGDCATPCCSCR